MEVKDILALANAGFTADQIAILAKTTDKAPEQPEQKAPEQPEQKAPETPAGDQNTQWESVLKEIKELKQTAVLGNILGSTQPPEQSVDDILAEIINPPLKEGDKK